MDFLKDIPKPRHDIGDRVYVIDLNNPQDRSDRARVIGIQVDDRYEGEPEYTLRHDDGCRADGYNDNDLEAIRPAGLTPPNTNPVQNLTGLIGKRIRVDGPTLSTFYDVLSEPKEEKGIHGDTYLEVLMVDGNGAPMRLYAWEIKACCVTIVPKP